MRVHLIEPASWDFAIAGIPRHVSLRYDRLMDHSSGIPTEAIEAFSISQPKFVERTGIATIWRVMGPGGSPAALKVYHGGAMGNETSGFRVLAALEGRGAARLYGVLDGMALMEWLDGPSLGDLVRSGRDREASTELVAVANRIHAQRLSITEPLPTLDAWFDALFSTNLSSRLAPSAIRDMQLCRKLARDLLASQKDIRPLHGDLHHDNIRLGVRGYCAFDAKGVAGERTYELANAFRNPKGAEDIVGNTDRIRFLADIWSEAFAVDRRRLLEWAVVKVALSICWRSGAVLEEDRELDLLSTIAGVLDAD